MIVREVKPPAVDLAESDTAPRSEATPPTPEQIAEWQAQAAKESRALMLSATVYDGEVTLLSWSYENEKFIAYTNADFNYLRGVHSLETDTHRYSIFMSVGEANRENSPYPEETTPRASTFSAEHSEYILAQGDANNEAALNGIAALLAHYNSNLPQLKIDLQRREALSAAQKRYDAANPKEPEPFIMQFWVPEPKTEEASE